MTNETVDLIDVIPEDKLPDYYSDITNGLVIFNKKDYVTALEHFNSLTHTWGEQAEIFFCLGIICMEYNRRGHALSFIERAHKLDPDCKDYADALAFIYTVNGKLSDGLYFAKLSLTLSGHPHFKPFCPPRLVNYAQALQQVSPSQSYFKAFRSFNQRNFVASKEECNTELQLNPNNTDCLQLLARVQMLTADYFRSTQTMRALNHMVSDNIETEALMVETLTNAGLHEQARPIALALAEKHWSNSQVLATLRRVLPLLGETKKLATMTRKWEKRFALLREDKPGTAYDIELGRRVNIGVICDFAYNCDEAKTLSSMIQKLDKRRFRTILYISNTFSDTYTSKMQNMFEEDRRISDVDGYTVSLTIEGDEIDVLIDATLDPLAEHYEILAERPAPVQIPWIGDTSPSSSIAKDYVISDVITQDVDLKNRTPTQKIVPIQNGLYCAERPTHYPDVVVKDNIKSGHIVYGVQYTPARITSEQIFDWAQILKATPKTLILFGNAQNICHQTQTNIVSEFGNYGLADRIRFYQHDKKDFNNAGKLMTKDFFLEIDVLLDTSAVSGVQEVIDALWMGIPVVTLRGKTRESLSASSILNSARHFEWSASSRKNYVKKAIGFAENGEALFNLRSKLRDEVANSPLFSPETFATDIENVYLSIIHR